MEYLIHIAILVCIYGILGISLNLVVGETGLLSIAHAAFYGIGAYVTAIVLTRFGINFFVAVPIAMLITMLIALPVGFAFSRLKGVYYVFGTLGFSVIAASAFLNWDSVTRGPLGVPGIPRQEIFTFVFQENIAFLLLAASFLAATYCIACLITASSFGRVLHAIREDEEAISVFGYETSHYKLAIFVISAALAATAGSLFATYITYIHPSSFNVSTSISILALVVLGGVASTRGALLGAFAWVIIPEMLRFAGFPADIAAQMQMVVAGLVLILLMFYKSQGILGRFKM